MGRIARHGCCTFVGVKVIIKEKIMKVVSGKLSNVEIKARIRQILFLVGAILVGVIISCAAEAQDFHKAKEHHFREKYKTQISVDKHACHILDKKRNVRHRTPLFASWHHSPKFKPQAEVDTPVQTQTNQPKSRRGDKVVAKN